jgi:hypothetical protein
MKKSHRTASTRVRLMSRSTHTSLSTCKGHKHFFPHDDGTFSAVQLPLPYKELPLQLNGHRMRRRQGPAQINEQKAVS